VSLRKGETKYHGRGKVGGLKTIGMPAACLERHAAATVNVELSSLVVGDRGRGEMY
jgi:hypothetical protein